MGQKDAQGPVSPLRVRIKRVWALRTWFAAIFGSSLIRFTEIWFFTYRPERCARFGFPPSGSYEASFGSARSFSSCFWRFFDSAGRSMDFLSICQKDAQGSVSPLWFRINRIWAMCARLATVFGGSLLRLTEILIFQAWARKMQKGRFPPFGFVSSEFGLCAIVLQLFGGFVDSADGIMGF